jgi:hypothetical protein
MQIPFERTVSGAYRFTFKNILSILGIGWFPFLLMTAFIAGLIYVLGPQLVDLFSNIPKGGHPDNATTVKLLTIVLGGEAVAIPVIMLISAMVTVGVMRKALGQHPEPVYFFFSLSSQVWRLFASYLLLIVLAWGGGLVFAVLAGFVFYMLSLASHGAAVAAIVLLVIAGLLFWIYAIVRVYFFLPAIVVAENHIGIRRSWHLGKGNFWRIVGIFLVMTIPAGIAVQVLWQSVLQFEFGGMPLVLGPHPSPEEAHRFLMALLDMLKRAAPFIVFIQLLYMTVLTGLMGAATANAYNLVTGGDDIAPPPPAKVPA